jgi:hypothetical protein
MGGTTHAAPGHQCPPDRGHAYKYDLWSKANFSRLCEPPPGVTATTTPFTSAAEPSSSIGTRLRSARSVDQRKFSVVSASDSTSRSKVKKEGSFHLAPALTFGIRAFARAQVGLDVRQSVFLGFTTKKAGRIQLPAFGFSIQVRFFNLPRECPIHSALTRTKSLDSASEVALSVTDMVWTSPLVAKTDWPAVAVASVVQSTRLADTLTV